MRFVATGLLVAMVVVFFAARHYEAAWPAAAWVRAFAEAAMVGALADWFAVTALFRHPMGIPIPHTAIVPSNKDRIGRNLGNFVEQHFLAPAVVRDKIAQVDFVEAFADWLGEGDRPRKLAERLAERVPGLLAQLDTRGLRHALQADLNRRLRRIELAPVAGEILALHIADGRHHRMVDQLIAELGRLLAEYEPAIRARVREKTAWYWRSIGVDTALSDKIVAAAEEVIAEMSRDLEHPWRKKFDAVLAELAHDLKTSDEYQRRLDVFKAELLDHPALQHYLASVWDEVQSAVLADIGRDDSVIVNTLERGLAALADTLNGDAQARARLNRWLRSAIVRVVEAQRHEVGHLIAETIRRWDAQVFTERIESYVGDDLQYVRINGTLIGGLVGLGIHAVSRVLG
jgi:uncharacterized membrane-anchored protein YjiN (DUF445 family)